LSQTYKIENNRYERIAKKDVEHVPAANYMSLITKYTQPMTSKMNKMRSVFLLQAILLSTWTASAQDHLKLQFNFDHVSGKSVTAVPAYSWIGRAHFATDSYQSIAA